MRTTALSVLLLAIPVAGAATQSSFTVERGASVLIRSVAPSGPDDATTCEARVGRIEQDTLLLGRPFGCPKGSYLARVRVARGNHGSRLAHAGIGLLAGGVAGGVVTRIAVGHRCTVGDCTDDAFVTGIRTMFGAAIGAAIGLTFGALLPAGPRWVDAGVRPVRVGAFTLRPELRLSTAESVGR